MQIAISQAAATLAGAPSFAEKFIGKTLLKQNLTPFGYADWKAFGTRVMGNGEGYQSVADAMVAARKLVPAWGEGKIGSAVAVVRNDGSNARFALVELDKPLVFNVSGKLHAAKEFHWFNAAVVAAINGSGTVLRNAGKAHWWNVAS